ncbi:MAG: SDR family NAD(P)-dependent oxidoreductase [Patescibacteria group bacterium]
MSETIKKILVTGSSGTIGTRLMEKLLEQGYQVIGVDWRPNQWSKTVNDFTIIGDLRDKAVLQKLPNDFDLVIHLAANARVYNLVVDPSMARDNFETTFNVLEFTRQNKIKRFMFASSRETYGNTEQIKYSEGDVRLANCESPYTASKIAGEAMVYGYGRCYNIDFVVFRFSNVYGMYDGSDRAVPLFIGLAKDNKPITIFGQDKLLDFTYIDDCVAGIMAAIANFATAKNDTYNLGAGQGSTIVEVAQMIVGALKSQSQIIIQDNRTGEVVKFIADITKAQQKLGYQPKVFIKDGLAKSIEWYQQNNFNE